MLQLRERLCFELSRRLIQPPSAHSDELDAYDAWRNEELASQWGHFSDADVRGKDVLDFGCGLGGLAFFVAGRGAKSVFGVDIAAWGIDRCNAQAARLGVSDRVRFAVNGGDTIPAEPQSFDTILAFDCLEHVLQPEAIVAEWRRVLRPGGKVLVWWSPFRGPYGPHMEALVPIPWAHVIFGERAIIETARRVYDLDEFVPNTWNRDADGKKKPNEWRNYRTLDDWKFINQLTERDVVDLCGRVGLEVSRLEPHSFQGSSLKRAVGAAMLRVPPLREYFTSYYILELRRPWA